MSLQRVSSRQRLVSWDAFDATLVKAEDAESDTETYETCLQTSISSASLLTSASLEAAEEALPLKRKRISRRSKQTKEEDQQEVLLHIIPTEDPDQEENNLSNLPDEVSLSILQFLDIPDVRNVMQTSKAQHGRLQDESSAIEAIWKPACQRQWPWMGEGHELEDTLGVTYNRLLQMSTPPTAICIDKALFAPPQRWSRSLRAYRPRRHSQPHHLQVLPGSAAAVQFTGPVGVGDRCIRGNGPLPRPQLLKKAEEKASSSRTKSLLYRLKNAAHHNSILCGNTSNSADSVRNNQEVVWRPFVAPIGSKLTPRLISYFEVSILPAPASQAQEERPRPFPLRAVGAPRTAPECVAVGLATESFCLHSRMPGWDSESWGYHGDDGGIFHANGSMVRHYGPSFGAGDVVGCGVDYQRAAIFYTLNGKFLDYAFDLNRNNNNNNNSDTNHLNCDLYPVIGLDTNCPVETNFGTNKPFQFDLDSMIAKQEDIVLQAIHT